MVNLVDFLGHLLECLLGKDMAIKRRSFSDSGVNEEMFGGCSRSALSYVRESLRFGRLHFGGAGYRSFVGLQIGELGGQ